MNVTHLISIDLLKKLDLMIWLFIFWKKVLFKWKSLVYTLVHQVYYYN